jgi:signal transduction histidine kinase
VDLAAYRVVQEALTNVHKHAGPDATALVRIVRSGGAADEALDITVLDDGGASDTVVKGVNGSGHGLTGMRERAAALSGSCEAGPLEGGGFQVRVSLPLRPPRAEEPESRERAGRCP